MGDLAVIDASVEYHFNKAYNCSLCIPRFGDKREFKGCFDTKTVELEGTYVMYTTCPGNLYHPSMDTWIRAAALFTSGTMPFHNSYANNPEKVIQLLETISGLVDQNNAKKAAK